MATRDTYEFRIEGLTPGTLPMDRLAVYLAELAALMGESERVHFHSVKKGSAVLVAYVEPQAAPKVRLRVSQANNPEAAPAVRKPYDRLNELLRDDNARGQLKVGSAKILRFPGRDLPRDERIGPFNEHTEVDGVLVRIGGIDDTAHAHIQQADGKTRICIVSRDKARELAPHLYGAPLRVTGSGRWQRTEQGEWELIQLRLADFRLLKNDELTAVVQRLRDVPGSGWSRDNDPLAALARIRKGDEGIH